jgi:hypothetical protein
MLNVVFESGLNDIRNTNNDILILTCNQHDTEGSEITISCNEPENMVFPIILLPWQIYIAI